MQCVNCGCEEFQIIRTYRGRRWSKTGWVVTNDIDTRKSVCAECGALYYEESRHAHVIEYDKTTMKQKTRELTK